VHTLVEEMVNMFGRVDAVIRPQDRSTGLRGAVE
jgi:hypothetical protein